MASNVLPGHQHPPSSRRGHLHVGATGSATLARFLVPLGRLFFTAIFLESVPGHFKAQTIAYAAHAGAPLANVLVPITGLLALIGGLSVLLGYHARIGAALLALFLVPVTLIMHAFWAVPDAAAAQLQMIMFMKNLAMLGGALLLMYFGAGPISIDERQGRL